MSSSPTSTIPVRRAPIRWVVACLTALGIVLVAVLPITTASAAPPVGLGTATSFAVLAGQGITNTGPTTITGDVGTHPNPSMTGFGTVTVSGSTHAADAVALQAKNDLTTAYNTAAAATPTTAVATELGGRTLTPGVYGSPTLGITGTLTLDTLGDPNAVFIFKAGSTLITASNSSVIVLNGGTACNVYWQVGSSATLGTGSNLIGTVLAATSISATTGATIQGRLLARNGAVTMDTNTITRPTCAAAVTTTTAAPTTTTTARATTTTTARATTTTTRPGTSTTAPGTGVTAPGGSGPVAPIGAPVGPGVLPTAGSGTGGAPAGSAAGGAPGGPTGRTAGPGTPFAPGSPGLPATGADLGLGLAGFGAVLVGSALLAAAKLRLRLARRV